MCDLHQLQLKTDACEKVMRVQRLEPEHRRWDEAEVMGWTASDVEGKGGGR